MVDTSEDGEKRGTWSGRLDFTMSALSFAVGMGNLWRFPYLCYRNGGGAFLFPYVATMVLCGYPLMLLELVLGQHTKSGIIGVWKRCPLLQGIGWGMFCVSLMASIYYVMIVAWCVFYLVSSLASDVPWRDCNNEWNSPACTTSADMMVMRNCSDYNGTWWNATCVMPDMQEYEQVYNSVNLSASHKPVSPSDEFFNRRVLDVSDGFHEPGGVRYQLLLCLLTCWIVVFLALAKGIRVSGKVTYITALFPYVVLTILLVRGLTLDGAVDGILYYITPQFDKLGNIRVWGEAAVQAFFSLSLCWGGLITLASYNDYKNDCVRDAIVVATGDMLTSIFGGFVIFAILGYMAQDLGVEIDKVATQGPGLAFIVYPEAITRLPAAPLWAVLFMLMLINIGIGSQMGLVSTVQTTLLEMFPDQLNRDRRPIYLLLALSISGFLLAIPFTTRGGVYFLFLMDTYCATYSLLVLAVAECVAVGWLYGTDRFYQDIEHMIGRRIGVWWKVCWRYISPIVSLLVMLFVILDFKRSSYKEYVYPLGWDLLGWGFTVIPILCVPIVALYRVLTWHRHMTFKEKMTVLCGRDHESVRRYDEDHNHSTDDESSKLQFSSTDV